MLPYLDLVWQIRNQVCSCAQLLSVPLFWLGIAQRCCLQIHCWLWLDTGLSTVPTWGSNASTRQSLNNWMWTLCNTDLFFAGPVAPVELSCFPSVSLGEAALGSVWFHIQHFLPSRLINIIYWLPHVWIGQISSHQVCSEAPGMSERRVRFCCQPFGYHLSSFLPYSWVTAAFLIHFMVAQTRKCHSSCPRQPDGGEFQWVLLLEGGSGMKNTSLGNTAWTITLGWPCNT